MGQRRAAGDAYRFELVPDEGRDLDAAGGPPSDDDPVPPTLLERVRAWPRRRVIAGVVVAAVVFGGGSVVTAAIERQRVAALLTAPGGVVDLSRPPERAWSVEAENGSPLTVMDGLVVVVSYGVEDAPEPENPELRAIDPADGSEVWARSFVGPWTCGPFSGFGYGGITLGRSETVVCVDGNEDGTVQVIDAAGYVVAERELRGSDVRIPAADGGLLRLEHVGEPGPLPKVVGDEVSGYRVDGPVIGPDLHVTMEDASTGAVRWDATVESMPTSDDNWYSCATWEPGTDEPVLAPADSGVYSWADDTVVVVGSCGVDAAFAPSGARLDLPSATPGIEPFGTPGGYESVRRTADGYYLRPAEIDERGRFNESPDAPWDLVDADGTLVRALPGRVVEPWATDGSHPGIVLTHDLGGLVAIQVSDGERLWGDSFDGTPSMLVRTRDLAVLVAAEGDLVAVDLDSGERRWTAELKGSGDSVMWGDVTSLVRAVFTDGRVAVVGTPGMGMPGAATWTAYDLRSGDVVWTWQTDLVTDGYGFTVDGRILYWDYLTLTALE